MTITLKFTTLALFLIVYQESAFSASSLVRPIARGISKISVKLFSNNEIAPKYQLYRDNDCRFKTVIDKPDCYRGSKEIQQIELINDAKNGIVYSQLELAKYYLGSTGVEPNYQKAFKWFKKAADNGNSDAMEHIAAMYVNHVVYDSMDKAIDDKNAYEWYLKAAEKGNMYAYFGLGLLHSSDRVNNKNTVENEIKAIEWYRKSADQGHFPAKINLALMLTDNKGASSNQIENDFEAVELLSSAANEGNEHIAKFHLGLMYFNNRGVDSTDSERNALEAMNWFRKAADQGNSDASLYLGYMYTFGIGVEDNDTHSNDRNAIKWFIKASLQGNREALNYLRPEIDKIYGVWESGHLLGRESGSILKTKSQYLQDGTYSHDLTIKKQGNGVELNFKITYAGTWKLQDTYELIERTTNVIFTPLNKTTRNYFEKHPKQKQSYLLDKGHQSVERVIFLNDKEIILRNNEGGETSFIRALKIRKEAITNTFN